MADRKTMVQVPSVGEIESVLSSKTMKVQITFVDGSNKWLVSLCLPFPTPYFSKLSKTVSGQSKTTSMETSQKNEGVFSFFEVNIYRLNAALLY